MKYEKFYQVRKGLLCGALFMMCTTGAFAQILLGTGYDYGIDGMNKGWITGRPARQGDGAPTEEENSLHTMWMGVGVRIPRLLGSSIDLETRANVAYSIGAMTEKLPEIAVFLPHPTNPDTMIAVHQIIRSDYRVRTQALWLDIVGRFPLYGPLRLESGLKLHYVAGATFEKRTRLVQPANSRFTDGTRERVDIEGTTLAASPFSAGVMAGFTYDIPFTTALTLRPGVRLRFERGTLDDGSSWDMYAVGASVGMLFGSPE